jgi:hypothetical protein
MSTQRLSSNERTGIKEHFEPFDLTVHLGPDGIPWLSAVSRAGSVHGVPREVLPLADLLDLVYDYADAVQFAEPLPDSALSHTLRELVFGDPMVLQLFQATRGVAADWGRQLLFRILASPHLAVLPWELLPDPTGVDSNNSSRYLATSADTHLVRVARGRTYPVRTELLEAPLNLLIVLSSPTPQDESEDWLAFDIFEVKRALLAELTPLVQARMLHIDVVDRPTLDNLRRQIGAQPRGYHLLHYVGHAQPDRLILEDRAGRREDLTSSQFVEILRLCPDLRLAVFAGCETARPATDPSSLAPNKAVGWRDLLSLADYCVQEACPTVIGMQAVLPFSTERVFTRFFYQALANGYSTAESLRLARGAIQSDKRPGEDLLDWSVPALFVGSGEPGALVPRSSAAAVLTAPVRSDLKLGLRQGNERFFARELPLRQAVHVMSGLAPERVLVVTGTAGAGKTSLVDRAMEELDPSDTKVLYVHFDRLSPEIATACRMLDAGKMPDFSTIAALTADHALERMCRLTAERLRLAGGTPRPRDEAWTIGEWWERLVEDLVQHRFVLAIDDVGLLDRAQRALLVTLVGLWLLRHLDTGDKKAKKKSKTGPKKLRLEEMPQLLIQLEDSLEQDEDLPESPQALPAISKELMRYLDGLPRLAADSPQVLHDFLEGLLVKLSYKAGLSELKKAMQDMRRDDSRNVMAALNALDAVRRSLGASFTNLADRRSPARIVITASDKLKLFLDVPDELVFEIRLAQLTWSEHWRWIRRNLPGLVSYGEEYLSRLWLRLGTQLDRWEELERRVLHERGKAVNLAELAAQIAPRRPTRPADGAVLNARRGERPLRIAVAGPHLAGPQALAEAMTRLAIEHGIGGRVVLGSDEGGALASVIDEPTPFDDTGQATMVMILKWLQRVFSKQPDIILLDYGSRRRIPQSPEASPEAINKSLQTGPEHDFLRSAPHGSLLIAAGGNRTDGEPPNMVTVPAAYAEVLAVGPLDDAGKLRPYAEWHPQLIKPDLFMTDNLAATALARALKPQMFRPAGDSVWGSSFSALHAVTAAALVWSILPELSPRAVRRLLAKASTPIPGAEPARGLNMKDAVALARAKVVDRTLKTGPASLQTLSAITGLDVQVLSATLHSLIDQGRVVRLTSGRLERFQLL